MTSCILIVDDVSSNLKVLKAKLEKEYYTVLSALSGKEALDIAQKLQPDLILLDIMMPEMDGFEVCQLLKSNFDTESIPVIFITALDDVESRIRGLNYGAEDFLTKPINDIALFTRIKSLARLKMFTDEFNIRSKIVQNIDSTLDVLSIKQSVNDLSNENILIIDDDELQSEQVQICLNDHFNHVIMCSNDIERFCANIHEQKDIALVIINMQSTNYDGLRLFSVLRSKHVIRNIPILMLIDEDNTSDLIKGMEIGINDYLTIPINSEELIARARLQIKKKKYHDALYNSVINNMEMATVDQLTKCYNRFYFDMHIKQKIMTVRRNNTHVLALLMFDIDFFKKVNDDFGHLVGDDVLKKITQLVRDNIRANDLLARFGGEEFVILLPNPRSVEDTLECANRLLDVIRMYHFIIDDKNYKITISIGGTHLQKDDDVNSFIARADKNLYEAKNSGRNQLIFNLV